MLRLLMSAIVLCSTVTPALAQNTAAKTATTSCTFEDGKQLSVRYSKQSAKSKSRLPDDKLWCPGGKPMFLFTQVDVMVGNAEIPAGAYSVYVIPQRQNWTLVVNKNVTEGSTYSEHEDLVREPMQSGQVSDPQPFSVSFGHIAPKQCNLRIYYGKMGTWAEFKEK